MLDLINLFDSLHIPTTLPDIGARFSAHPIPGYEQHRLAKDKQGAPLLLLSVAATTSRSQSTPIVLEHLSVQHNVDCRISQSDGQVEEGCFTVVRCSSMDRALHSYFLRVANSVIVSLGTSPSQQDVTRVIDKLVELFRAMTELPRKSVQGLWAELFLMVHARNPVVLAQAWHVVPEDRYDFNAGDQRIEVKSTVGQVRQHYFALEQLHPPAGASLLIASVFVERAGGGLSAADIVEQVRSRVSGAPDILLHIDRIVGLTLGENWRYASEERFDHELAKESLAFFEPGAIPKISPKLPLGVSDVRFKSDLSGIPTVDLLHYKAMGGLFQAALRR